MAIGQFYHVAVDNRQPYRVYGGLQDNGSWGGPSRTLHGTGPDQRGLDRRRRRRRLRLPRRSERPGPRLLREPGRQHGAGATCGPASTACIRPARAARASRPTASTGTRRSSCRSHNSQHLLLRRQLRLPLAQAGRRPAGHLAGDHADQARQRHRPGRVAAQPRRALGRHRRRRPVGDARRRREVDERRRQGRPAGAALGGQHRAVALRRGPGLCRLRRPPLRRRRAVRLRHRGLRRDLEVAARQPADRLDARAARGHREPGPALSGHRVRASGRRSTAARSWTKINNNLPTVAVHEFASTRRRARSWRRRTAAACGSWT